MKTLGKALGAAALFATTATTAAADIEGRVCWISELKNSFSDSAGRIKQVHDAATVAIDRVIEKRLGTRTWSGKSAAQQRGVERILEANLPNSLTGRFDVSGDREFGMNSCNARAQAIANSRGKPQFAVGYYGPQGGVKRADHQAAGEYKKHKVGDRIPFAITGGTVFTPK